MSVPATLEEVCDWTGGSVLRGRADQRFDHTIIDSREAGPGALFIAIVGEKHDAHRFLDDVLAKDVAGIVIQSDHVSDTIGPSDGFVVHVEDTTRALADIAHGHRQSFSGPVIGITGSNGKTTTKELCASILMQRGPTLATRGNLNNQFGVPLTLLRRELQDEFAIIEMGMNHRGEIAGLAAIARPTIGVLTNIGTAHIEFLGSRENIATEKGDLLAALPSRGTAIVGRDDPLSLAQAKRTPGDVLTFGRDPRADLCASRIQFVDASAFSFDLETPRGRGEIRVSGLSETIVDNALAAAGGALAAGASFDDVAIGLANHTGVPGRMQPRILDDDILIIDDTYNANPQSMRNALESLAQLETAGRRYAVLGEMGELGVEGDRAHREAGELAAELELDGLYFLGASADLVEQGARSAGMPPDAIHVAASHDEIATALRERLSKGDRVLVKGSRAAAMERVIHELTAEVGD